jgi:fermentation-respiration switch protein FrsA (DUF1100 family)
VVQRLARLPTAEMNMFIALIVGAALFAGGLVVGVRILEPSFAFFPTAGETTTPLDFGVPFEPSTVTTHDGERLRVWTLPHPQPLATIVYFHGNGGNLSVWSPILSRIQQQRFTVIAFDYRGYGASTGRPSERGLYRDVEAIVDSIVDAAARSNRPAIPIIFWGRSLGTAMAAYAATVARPDGLILESGFPDARTLVRSSPPLAFLALFSTYRFPTAEFVERAASPVLVLHGDRDRVIPFALGRALFERISGPKEFVTVRGGDHNDIVPADQTGYWDAIDRFIVRVHSKMALPRRTE